MRELTDICRRTDRAKADSKPKDEAAAHEHFSTGSRCLQACPQNDNHGTGKHTHASAQVVVGGAGEWHSGDRANIVKSKDEAGSRTCFGPGITVRH